MRKYVGTYVGQPTPSEDAFSKVTGTTEFTDDLVFPNLLWGKVLTSPIAHGRIKSIDTSKAEALPGVRAVITYRDAPETPYNRIMRWMRDDLPATERVLDQIVRFVGDKVAAVAADSEAVAAQAVKLIEVEYEPLPLVLDPVEALKPDAPALYPEGNLLRDLVKTCGDVDSALSEAEVTVENEVSTAMIHHGALEPHVCVGQWTRGGDLSIWEPQQGVHRVQVMLGKIFSVPYSKIHVHGALMGGSFGGKDGILLEPLTLLLSKKAGGRPVKIRYNRTESMISTYTRHAVKLTGKMALNRDGTITGFAFDSWMNAGPYCSGSINVQAAMCGKLFKVYRAPNVRFHGRAVYTNTPVGGAMRGFGSPKIFTALELLINKAAVALDMDPVELRRRNLVQPFDRDPASGESLGSARVLDCLNEGADCFGWAERYAGRKNLEDERYVYGYGVATSMHGNGVAPFAPDISTAELMLHEDGTVLLRTGMTDHGAGTYTLLKQVVAETLDMPMEHVMLIHSDTDSGVYDMGAGASRNTWTGASAVIFAAKQLKSTIMSVAAALLDCPESSVIAQDGGYRAGPGGRLVTKQDVAAYAYTTQKRKLIEAISYDSPHNAGSYGAHFAQVRIDKQTGEVAVLDYLAYCDVGTPLNPMLLEGQIQGAILMGLGMSLFEEIKLDEKGVPVNANLKKYRLPRVSDRPNITVRFVDNYEEDGPYGGKSVGESSIVPVVPAIVGAINDALGAELGQLPLTPDKILNALALRQ